MGGISYVRAERDGGRDSPVVWVPASGLAAWNCEVVGIRVLCVCVVIDRNEFSGHRESRKSVRLCSLLRLVIDDERVAELYRFIERNGHELADKFE